MITRTDRRLLLGIRPLRCCFIGSFVVFLSPVLTDMGFIIKIENYKRKSHENN